MQLPAMPTVHTVQPVGNGPLGRAFDRICEGGSSHVADETQRLAVMNAAANSRDKFMFPWENPHSIAGGILDDETYDWLALCDGMLQTGGTSHAVDDDIICQAKAFATGSFNVPVCHTGSAGLAGLVQSKGLNFESGVNADPTAPPDLIILSGLDRTA